VAGRGRIITAWETIRSGGHQSQAVHCHAGRSSISWVGFGDPTFRYFRYAFMIFG
jgi:hypothetical protein